MQFPTRPRRRQAENIVPMINVVFLLLIFFLMTARIVPPTPIEVDPPTGETAMKEVIADGILYIASDGTLAYGTARGESVWSSLAVDGPLVLRVDAGLEASELASVLRRLAERGLTDLSLTVASP